MKEIRSSEVLQKAKANAVLIYGASKSFPEKEAKEDVTAILAYSRRVAEEIEKASKRISESDRLAHLSKASEASVLFENMLKVTNEKGYLPSVQFRELLQNNADVKRMLTALLESVPINR